MSKRLRSSLTGSARRRWRAVLPVACAVLACTAAAQVYRVTDEQGNVVFTDRPEPPTQTHTVERVDLPTINRAPSVTPRAAPPAEEAPAAAAPVSVAIVAPAPETTVAMGPGNFNVSATTAPSLGRGEQLQLLIDGQPHGAAQRSSSWFVEGAVRGEHRLRVARLNAAGNVVAESDDVRIYVLRPSVLR